MKLKIYSTAQDFWKSTEVFFMEAEAENNLAISLLDLEMKDEFLSIQKKGRIFATIEHFDQIRLVLMMLPPRNLFISGQGKDLTNEIKLAASFLINQQINIPGVFGPSEIAREFSEYWEINKECRKQVKFTQGIYVIEEIEDLRLSSGFLKQANMNNVVLISDWIKEFYKDALNEKISEEKALNLAMNSINETSLYLWEDKEPVSMLKKTRPTQNGIAITYVFTPKKYQNNGYATSSVAKLSQLLLKEGYQFCTLYADISNIVSTNVYNKVGYKLVRNSLVIEFKNS